jgi:GT2 family glycosyltransferase
MPTEPEVTVVIPTWNRRDDLERTLVALGRHKAVPFEVIVVDNASTDGTAELVHGSFPEVNLIRLPRNIGPTGARNVGVANAKAEIVVLLDSDTEPLEGAIDGINRRLREDPRLGAVNALQIDARTGRPWWWWGPYGYPEAEYLDREFDSAFKVEEGASGFRRSVYELAGGFDERFFMLVEGRDLAARVVREGYAIRYCPEVRFLHRSESNRPQSNAVYRHSGRLYYEFRNELWYTWRYFPAGWAVIKSAANLVTNLGVAIREHAIGAWLRGNFDGVMGLGWVLRHRLPLDTDSLHQVVSRDNRRWLRPLRPEITTTTTGFGTELLEPPRPRPGRVRAKRTAVPAVASANGAHPTYRVAFLMQQVLGHVTHSANLKKVVLEDPDIETVWVPITYRKEGGWIERLPVLPAHVKGVLRGAADVQMVLAKEKVDALLFNSPALATSAAWSMNRVPTTISLDITPRQFDREGVHFGHTPDGRGQVADLKHRWNQRIFSRCVALAPWSSWVQSSLESDYGVDPSKIVVIPPGVEVEAWAPRAVERRALPQVLFVGGDFRRKGGDLVLDWFYQRGRGLCELQIVSEDPAVVGLEAPDIHVHRGLRPNDTELRQVYWGSDVFVLPSRSEPFGIACVEALASGLPVVATAVGGLTDIVEPGEDGYLVAPGDSRALGNAIETLLASEPLRRAMGEHGMRVAHERFDAGRNGRRLLDLVKATVDWRRGAVKQLASEVAAR